MEFNWEDFKNHKCVVCCKTEEEAKEFINECYKHGISWIHSCENETNWKWYEKDTYYNCDVELHLSYGNINNGLIVDLPVVKYKEDNKMELKEGMIIECRNGERYLLRTACGELVASSNDKYISLDYDEELLDYDEELNENKYFNKYFNKDFDVMKIYTSNALILNNLFNDNYLECIWERKEPKKMTLAQISKELGYEVEVIDNE